MSKPSFNFLPKILINYILLSIFTIQIASGNENDAGPIIPDIKIRLIDGSSTTIHQLTTDGPLLIDFWATWCAPCKKVMKFLNEYHEKYAKENFKVLMINTDTPRSLAKVKSFIRSQKYSFNIGMDPNKVIAKKLNGMIMPTLILVDKNGIVKWRHQGYVAGEEIEIEEQIKQVLGKKNINEKNKG
ncbi:MAG: TlpA disulfide reductase family protein [Candidatus Neomarinimicrobiota bacterium]